jgi:alpha-beta hydrolase superfamily lysophospholipase
MQLEVGWRPDKLVFLAQGQPPFTLAAGSANDALNQYPQHRIYGDRSLATLVESNGGMVAASLGPRYELGGPDRLVATKPINWRTLMLWFGLVMGVVFVGLMASKTIRELRSANQIDSR